jgi:hypothetical protein
MASTLGNRPLTPGSSDMPVVSLSAPTSRRPSWVVAGVVLVGLAALLGAYVFSAATDTIRVVVASTDLAPGEVIGPEDLRVVELGRTSELRAIVAEQQSLIIGLAPRSEIPGGTVLNTDLFVPAASVIPAGRVVAGASFGPGAVPTASLSVGQSVAILIVQRELLGTADVVDEQVATLLGTGTVWSVEGDPSANVANETWLSLLLDADLQTRFAQAASEGRIRLSLVGT